MIYIGTENLFPRILTADDFSEISQYKSDQENMTVFPKHVTPPNNDNKGKGIAGLESIHNPFKVTLYPIQNTREI